MVEPNKELLACYQCGWLGMCIVACPLVDPTQIVFPASSCAPDVDLRIQDPGFEIVTDEKSPPADEDS